MQVFDDERRGAKRVFDAKPVRERREITKDILQAIPPQLDLNGHDDINLCAAFYVAFAAFLRVDEFTWNITWTQQSHITNISRASIQFTNDNSVLLHLPASKTDHFRQGIIIPLSPADDCSGPITAFRRLFQ